MDLLAGIVGFMLLIAGGVQLALLIQILGNQRRDNVWKDHED